MRNSKTIDAVVYYIHIMTVDDSDNEVSIVVEYFLKFHVIRGYREILK